MKWAIIAIVGLAALQVWYPEILPSGLRGRTQPVEAVQMVEPQPASMTAATPEDPAATGQEGASGDQPADATVSSDDPASSDPTFEMVPSEGDAPPSADAQDENGDTTDQGDLIAQ